LPSAFDVNDGEGIFINGKVVACAAACITWHTSTNQQWAENFPIPETFTNEDAATMLSDGTWLVAEDKDDPLALASYDAGTELFTTLPGVDGFIGGHGFCMVELRPNVLAMLDKYGSLFNYDLGTQVLKDVGFTSFITPEKDQGSCHLLMNNGVKTGEVIF
jgi:hypothetical protein